MFNPNGEVVGNSTLATTDGALLTSKGVLDVSKERHLHDEAEAAWTAAKAAEFEARKRKREQCAAERASRGATEEQEKKLSVMWAETCAFKLQ